MDFSIDERASAQAFEVWRRIAAEPYSWSPEAAEPTPEPPPQQSEEAARAVMAAIVAVANAPLPAVALLSLLLRPLRRLRLGRLRSAPCSHPALGGRALA